MAHSMTKRLVSLSLVSGALACNAVLGFDEATVDPQLVGTSPPGGDAGAQTQGVTCDSYCATVMTNCTGVQTEYLSEEICRAMCSHFELGVQGDTTEDSLACRAYHAFSAQADPRTHCKHAGPTGAGHCGAVPCNAFCALTSALCTGPLEPFAGGELACRQECAKFLYLLGPDDPDLVATGPTLNCRLWHLQSAYEPGNPQAKPTHCPHLGVMSTVCL